MEVLLKSHCNWVILQLTGVSLLKTLLHRRCLTLPELQRFLGVGQLVMFIVNGCEAFVYRVERRAREREKIDDVQNEPQAREHVQRRLDKLAKKYWRHVCATPPRPLDVKF